MILSFVRIPFTSKECIWKRTKDNTRLLHRHEGKLLTKLQTTKPPATVLTTFFPFPSIRKNTD